MATLTPLRPNGTFTIGALVRYSYTTSWSETTTPADANNDLTQTITSSPQNGDLGIALPSGHNAGSTFECGLDDVPGDFASMSTLNFRFSADQFSSYSDDLGRLAVRIMDGSTVLAAYNATTSWQAIHYFNGSAWSSAISILDSITANGGIAAAPAYDVTKAFAYVNTTAGAAAWNAARMFMHWFDDRNMGSDGAAIILDDVELTGTYETLPKALAPDRILSRRPRGNFINATRY